ncbi:leucine-rich repeat flightless-interacting protein 1 isoform X11 [Cyprinodon tularosa]|uniref:leucine-rich repeat flightless-interacting protein 1 isoform X11 n=1 Tax=Cyprinodon tularosa TaxID=77115 RepID=UPI0018E1E8FA|nr:leucine-rich repeat flightless-interacting protein 1 isoform X11 [Cyprinodon tularosa]
MGTQGTGRKRSTKKDRSTAEDEALDRIAREAEARLAAKRAARAEAREIRMKELERQQKELSDDDERMSVGSRSSVRSDLDSVGAYGGGGSALQHKAKKKKKHRHKDRTVCRHGFSDDGGELSCRSSRLSDEGQMSRSRLDLQPASHASLDLYGLSGPSSSRTSSLSFAGYQGSVHEDSLSLCSGSRRASGSGSHPVEYSSYRSSRASSRTSSARTSPVVEDRDYLVKGPRAASALTAATLTSLGGTSSRRGSGETALTVDAESSIREIKEIHELKDQIQDVEAKYLQNLKEVKDAMAEVEEKYRKAMVSNAQLDNEKNNLMYQVDTLKDSLMELEELLSESRREFDEKVKDLERQRHAHSVLQFQFSEMKQTLQQSEELLNEIRQLRLKQEAQRREIGDLQETLEWKEKKMGALERQKEYADAIRLERDELREEVVQLKDVLKKHGIVLGPDLSINGEAGPSDAMRSPGEESLSQTPPDSQTSAAEGNSVLGGTEEEVEQEEQRESLEDDQENKFMVDVEGPPKEQKTSLPSEVHSHLQSASASKASVIVSHDFQEIQESEGNVPQTEKCEQGHSKGHPEEHETNPSEGQESMVDIGEGGDAPQPQETLGQAVTSEHLVEEYVPVGSNTEPLQEPEEPENREAEETASKPQSQISTTSAKKKKKKKKGKKKGTHENKDQQRPGTEKETGQTDSVVCTDGPAAEPGSVGSISESGQGNPEPEQVDAAKCSETFSLKENLHEPNPDHDNKETMNTQNLEAEVLEPSKKLLKEIRAGHHEDPKDEEKPAEPKSLEYEAPDNLTEGSSPLKHHKESRMEKECSRLTSHDPEGSLLTSKDSRSPLNEDASIREDIPGVPQSSPDQFSDEEEQGDALGPSETSGLTDSRLELSEDEQSQGRSREADKPEPKEPTKGFLQDDQVAESVPESRMVGDDGRVTAEEDVAIETPDTSNETRVDLLKVVQSHEEKPDSVTEIPKCSSEVGSMSEPGEADPNPMGEEDLKPSDEKETEPPTSPDAEGNPPKSGGIPDSPSGEDSSRGTSVKNIHSELEPVDGDETMTTNPEGISESFREEDGVPETRVPEGDEVPAESESTDGSKTDQDEDSKDEPIDSSAGNICSPSRKEPRERPEEASEPDHGEPKTSGDDDPQMEEGSAENQELNEEPEDPREEGREEGVDLTKTDAEAASSRPPKEDQTEFSEELKGSPARPEPEDNPNNKEIKPSPCPPVEQINKSVGKPESGASSPLAHLNSEEEEEEDEGQSFDFDDSDLEAAVASAQSNQPEPADVEEQTTAKVGEVNGNGPELFQTTVETNGRDDEKFPEEDAKEAILLEEGAEPQNCPRRGDAIPETLEDVTECIQQEASSAVELGVDAAELTTDSGKIPEQSIQSGKDSKKKKGKGKGKEDCKMA